MAGRFYIPSGGGLDGSRISSLPRSGPGRFYVASTAGTSPDAVVVPPPRRSLFEGIEAAAPDTPTDLGAYGNEQLESGSDIYGVRGGLENVGGVVSAPFRGLGQGAALAQEYLADVPDEQSRIRLGPEGGFADDFLGKTITAPTPASLAIEGYKLAGRAALGTADVGTESALTGESDALHRAAFEKAYPGLSRTEAVAEPLAELGAQFVTDPALGMLGRLGKIGELGSRTRAIGQGVERAIGASFVPGMTEGAIHSGGEAIESYKREGLSPNTLRAGTRALGEGLMAGFGAYHGIEGGKAAENAEYEGKLGEYHDEATTMNARLDIENAQRAALAKGREMAEQKAAAEAQRQFAEATQQAYQQDQIMQERSRQRDPNQAMAEFGEAGQAAYDQNAAREFQTPDVEAEANRQTAENLRRQREALPNAIEEALQQAPGPPRLRGTPAPIPDDAHVTYSDQARRAEAPRGIEEQFAEAQAGAPGESPFDVLREETPAPSPEFDEFARAGQDAFDAGLAEDAGAGIEDYVNRPPSLEPGGQRAFDAALRERGPRAPRPPMQGPPRPEGPLTVEDRMKATAAEGLPEFRPETPEGEPLERRDEDRRGRIERRSIESRRRFTLGEAERARAAMEAGDTAGAAEIRAASEAAIAKLKEAHPDADTRELEAAMESFPRPEEPAKTATKDTEVQAEMEANRDARIKRRVKALKKKHPKSTLTQLKEHAADQDAADHDTLTDLPNTRVWEREEKSGKWGGRASADLGGLKLINDAEHLGHDAGDVYLRSVAVVLARVAKRMGAVVTRKGGDEFVIFGTDVDHAHKVAAQMKRELLDHTIEYVAPDGTVTEFSGPSTEGRAGGPRLDYGYGKDFKEADQHLYSYRDRAEQRGHRIRRDKDRPGGRPERPGVPGVAPEPPAGRNIPIGKEAEGLTPEERRERYDTYGLLGGIIKALDTRHPTAMHRTHVYGKGPSPEKVLPRGSHPEKVRFGLQDFAEDGPEIAAALDAYRRGRPTENQRSLAVRAFEAIHRELQSQRPVEGVAERRATEDQKRQEAEETEANTRADRVERLKEAGDDVAARNAVIAEMGPGEHRAASEQLRADGIEDPELHAALADASMASLGPRPDLSRKELSSPDEVPFDVPEEATAEARAEDEKGGRREYATREKSGVVEETAAGTQKVVPGSLNYNPNVKRKTQGRESEGPLFTQDEDARIRKEEKSQGTLFDEPAPKEKPAEEAPVPKPGGQGSLLYASRLRTPEARRAAVQEIVRGISAKIQELYPTAAKVTGLENLAEDAFGKAEGKPGQVEAAVDLNRAIKEANEKADARRLTGQARERAIAQDVAQRMVEATIHEAAHGPEGGHGERFDAREKELRRALGRGFEEAVKSVREEMLEYATRTERARTGLTEEHVRGEFPTARKVTKTADGFQVELPHGRAIRINTDGEIYYDADAFMKGHGHPLPPDRELAGSWQKIDRGGIIALAKGSGQHTLRHEVFHSAMALALSAKEKLAVIAKYGDEEKAAQAYADWKPTTPHSVFAKIHQFFNKIYRRFSPDAMSAFEAVHEGKAFERAGEGGGAGDAAFATAYHGSPHDFDKFELSEKTSRTGEGAQSFGHGLYFAGRREIAEHYRQKLSGGDRGQELLVNGTPSYDALGMQDAKGLRNNTPEARAAMNEVYTRTSYYKPEIALERVRQDLEKTRENMRQDLTDGKLPSESYMNSIGYDHSREGLVRAEQYITNAIDFMDNNKLEVVPPKRGGKLYEVDLKPEEHEYLQWDKPLHGQSPEVLERLKAVGYEPESSRTPAQLYDNARRYFEGERAQADHREDIGMRERVVAGYKAWQKGKDEFFDWATRQDPNSWVMSRMLGPKGVAQIGNAGHFYRALAQEKRSPEAASRFLHDAGIPGIKYLDSTSRGKGEGSHNYVIFDDKHVETKAKYATRPVVPPGGPLPPQARTPPPRTSPVPEETRGDKFVRLMQDRFIRAQRVIDAVVKGGGTVNERTDFRTAEELFHGAVNEKVSDAEKRYEPTLAKALAKSGLDLPTLDKFLTARHAGFRNAEIARRHEGRVTAGSGMSNREAAQVLADYHRRGLTAKLTDAVKLVDKMRDEQRKVLLDSGLVSKEQLKGWEDSMGPHYVPLRTAEVEGGVGTGQGFDIRGKEAKYAAGRTTEADSPSMFMLAQLTRAIVRAEKNKVGQRFAEFTKANPDPTLWEHNVEHKTWAPNAKGVATEVKNPGAEANDFDYKVNGVKHRITVKDPLLLRALKNMSATETNQFLQLAGKGTRLFSALVTSYSPEFPLTNFARDIQTALGNVSAEQGGKIAREMVTNIPKAMKGVYDSLRNPGQGGQWAQRAKEFREDGGAVGFYQLKHVPALEREMARKIRGAGPGVMPAVGRALTHVKDLVEDINKSVENGTRLAIYSAVRDAGGSRQKAAKTALNATINFSKKGEVGPAINSLYAFFNANVQGAARMAQVLKTPKGKKIAAGIIALGAAQDLFNRAQAGDANKDGTNDYDDIPEYVKSRNMVFMTGEGNKPILFPLPYGFNVLHTAGRQMVAGAQGAVTPVRAGANVVSGLVNAFNPLGGEADAVQMLSPTALDPIVQDVMNRDFTGKPIRPEKFPGSPEKPSSEQYFKNVSPVARELAKTLNTATGGDKVTPGLVSVSPETMGHYWNFLTGGMGRFVSNTAASAASLAEGETPALRNIPYARRFAYEPPESASGQKFRANADELDTLWGRYKTYAEAKDADKVKGLPIPMLRVKKDFDSIENRIREIRKYVKEHPDEEKRADDAVKQLQNRANAIVAKARQQAGRPPNPDAQ